MGSCQQSSEASSWGKVLHKANWEPCLEFIERLTVGNTWTIKYDVILS